MITPVKKSDLPMLAKLYKLAFNSTGEKRTDESALKILEYRYPKKIKIKITVKKNRPKISETLIRQGSTDSIVSDMRKCDSI